MFNFKQQSNGLVCTCKRHHGVGEWSPQRRVAVYKRMVREMPSVAKPHMFEFVEDWENYHGRIYYANGVVDVNPGNIRKEDKGKEVYGAIFVEQAA